MSFNLRQFLNQCFSTGGCFTCWDLWLSPLVGAATGIWWVETRDAVPYLTMRRAASPRSAKTVLAQGGSSAKVETPC